MKKCMAATLFVASAGMAQAGGTHDMTGVVTGKTDATFHQISEGHMVMEFTNTQTSYDMQADGHPMSGVTGRCMGALELRGPSVSGGGMCVGQTADGDMLFVRWEGQNMTADGALNGNWTMVGGTGKMAGITGGGHYHSLTDRSTGDYVNTLTGAVTLP